MNDRTKSNWGLAATMTALTLLPVGLVAALLVGARGPDPADTRTPVSSVALVPTGVPSGPLDSPPGVIQSPRDMAQQH